MNDQVLWFKLRELADRGVTFERVDGRLRPIAESWPARRRALALLLARRAEIAALLEVERSLDVAELEKRRSAYRAGYYQS